MVEHLAPERPCLRAPEGAKASSIQPAGYRCCPIEPRLARHRMQTRPAKSPMPRGLCEAAPHCGNAGSRVKSKTASSENGTFLRERPMDWIGQFPQGNVIDAPISDLDIMVDSELNRCRLHHERYIGRSRFKSNIRRNFGEREAIIRVRLREGGQR